MRDVLTSLTPALRGCAELAGGLLFVRFTTLADRDTFDIVAISDSVSPSLDRCVRDATAGARFEPQGAETFTREYTP